MSIAEKAFGLANTPKRIARIRLAKLKDSEIYLTTT